MHLNIQTIDNTAVSFLEEVCLALDLTDTQRKVAERAYLSVGEWLAAPGTILNRYSPSVYPQGSFLHGTIVKPEDRNDFDVDLVCWLSILANATNSGDVFKLVWKRLEEHATYKAKMKAHNRCIRLFYDDFHLDITPAVPKLLLAGHTQIIQVPDRELKTWKDSYPKGYSFWFEEAAKALPNLGFQIAANRQLSENVEPFPDDSGFNKAPLKRIVQLLKRHRDVYFKKEPEHQVISIIITTLAAHAYSRMIGKEFVSIYDLLKEVVAEMPEFIEIRNVGSTPQWWLENPVIRTENFAEKWNNHPEREQAFRAWHKSISAFLDDLEKLGGGGLDKLKGRAAPIFGESITNRAITALGKRTSNQHQSGNLRIGATGLIAPFGVPVRKNTYFGGNE